jgi:ssDNA-binding Zn-finger/Zn-ribbon topoisomerase 1
MCRVEIFVPDAYFDQMPELDFKVRLETWLIENGPCPDCHGDGVINPTGRYGPEDAEYMCSRCGGKPWEAPI